MFFKKQTIGVLILVASLGLSATEAEPRAWWNKHWEYRVDLNFKNDSTVDLNGQVVVINGKQFEEKTGIKDVKSASFRLFKEGVEAPVQVDERDNTGRFVSKANGVLDEDDEIVFEVDLLKSEKTKYVLYFSKKLKPKAEYGQCPIKVLTLLKNSSGQLKVTTPKLNFIVKGPRSEPDLDPEKITSANFGCGAITSLEVKGQEMIDFHSSYSRVIPAGGRNIPYSIPKLVIEGPVRKVIELKRSNYQVKVEEQVAYEGDNTRYYAVYKDGGRIDFEDNFVYKKWDMNLWKKKNRGYGAVLRYYPAFSGGSFTKSDSLIVPLGGPTEIDMGKIELKEEGNQIYFKTPTPEAGYLAWIDKESEIGLSAFFDPACFSVTVYSRAPGKNINTRYGRPSNLLNYNIPPEAFVGKSLKVGMSFFVVENKAEVKAYYDFWEKPSLTFGFVEEK